MSDALVPDSPNLFNNGWTVPALKAWVEWLNLNAGGGSFGKDTVSLLSSTYCHKQESFHGPVNTFYPSRVSPGSLCNGGNRPKLSGFPECHGSLRQPLPQVPRHPLSTILLRIGGLEEKGTFYIVQKSWRWFCLSTITTFPLKSSRKHENRISTLLVWSINIFCSKAYTVHPSSGLLRLQLVVEEECYDINRRDCIGNIPPL